MGYPRVFATGIEDGDAWVLEAAPLLALPGAESRLRCYVVLFELTILASALRRSGAVPTARGWARGLREAAIGRDYLDRRWPEEATGLYARRYDPGRYLE